MNTQLQKTAYQNAVEVFKTINQLNAEFKQGQGVDYLIRLGLKYQDHTDEEFVSAIVRAFTPTKNEQRRQSESAGWVTGLQKAIGAAAGLRTGLNALVTQAPGANGQAWDAGGLNPAIVKHCASQANRAHLAHHWIGIADALDLTHVEIGQMFELMLKVESRVTQLKPQLLDAAGLR